MHNSQIVDSFIVDYVHFDLPQQPFSCGILHHSIPRRSKRPVCSFLYGSIGVKKRHRCFESRVHPNHIEFRICRFFCQLHTPNLHTFLNFCYLLISLNKVCKTRQHSSRMCTARLPTLRRGACMDGGGHVWWKVCMAEGRHAWLGGGACMAEKKGACVAGQNDRRL